MIQGVFELAQRGLIPSGTKKNLDFVSPSVDFSKNISDEQKYIAADAQTSGGLLISVAKDKAEALQQALKEQNTLAAAIVGQIYNPAETTIYIN